MKGPEDGLGGGQGVPARDSSICDIPRKDQGLVMKEEKEASADVLR